METKRKLTDAQQDLKVKYFERLSDTMYYFFSDPAHVDGSDSAIPQTLHETVGFRREGIFDKEERALIYKTRLMLRTIRKNPEWFAKVEDRGEIAALAEALDDAANAVA